MNDTEIKMIHRHRNHDLCQVFHKKRRPSIHKSFLRLKLTFLLIYLIPFSTALSSRPVPLPQLMPCVGCVTSSQPGVKYFVIGTSHLRCKSAAEVASLIQEVKPDGVVVELDPERVIRLTKEGSLPSNEGQNLLFGADFLAAVDTSREMNIPLFIGDESPEMTKSRLISTMFSPETYRPGKMLSSLRLLPSRSKQTSDNSIDLWKTFMSDPMKLTPLGITIAIPFFLFLMMVHNFRVDDGIADASVFLSLVWSFFVTSKIFNTLIADRDEIISSNAMNAANVARSLQNKETIRKSWTFTVRNSNNNSIETDEQIEALTPLFTLKTPLERGKVRRLNLFEPRWLHMIDSLADAKDQQMQSQFGCVSCTNKFYSAITINGVEGRYADVIFKRKGTMATLTDIKEGTRPSGDRKVLASIKGGDSFVVDERNLSVVDEGYLVTSGISSNTIQQDICSEEDKDEEDINIVVVVGLLHVNGILDRLSLLK